MNKYHLNLKIPVKFDFPSYQIPNKDFHYHTRFHKSDMTDEFKQWIYSLGLSIMTGEFFYTPPHRTLEPHSDSQVLDDVVKLNWMQGGEGSVMDWYELKEGFNLRSKQTSINTYYTYAPMIALNRIHTAIVGFPSLVNVGRIHGIRNRSKPRYVACVVLNNPKTDQRLTWAEAQAIFQPYAQ